MEENLKEKILINTDAIQELLDNIQEIEKNNYNTQLNTIKIIKKKCYHILGRKYLVRWYQRLRQKNINNQKIRKKGIIFKIK